MEYPLSGNRRTLTNRETASTKAKIMVSRLANVKLTAFSPDKKTVVIQCIRSFFQKPQSKKKTFGKIDKALNNK